MALSALRAFVYKLETLRSGIVRLQEDSQYLGQVGASYSDVLNYGSSIFANNIVTPDNLAIELERMHQSWYNWVLDNNNTILDSADWLTRPTLPVNDFFRTFTLMADYLGTPVYYDVLRNMRNGECEAKFGLRDIADMLLLEPSQTFKFPSMAPVPPSIVTGKVTTKAAFFVNLSAPAQVGVSLYFAEDAIYILNRVGAPINGAAELQLPEALTWFQGSGTSFSFVTEVEGTPVAVGGGMTVIGAGQRANLSFAEDPLGTSIITVGSALKSSIRFTRRLNVAFRNAANAGALDPANTVRAYCIKISGKFFVRPCSGPAIARFNYVRANLIGAQPIPEIWDRDLSKYIQRLENNITDCKRNIYDAFGDALLLHIRSYMDNFIPNWGILFTPDVTFSHTGAYVLQAMITPAPPQTNVTDAMANAVGRYAMQLILLSIVFG